MVLDNIVSKNWKKVHEQNYAMLNIQSTDSIKCLGAYIVGEGGDSNVVSFMKYVGYTKEFLAILDKTFDNFNAENELVDGDPEDKDYYSTSMVHNLFHGFSKFMGKVVYMNINRVAVASGVTGYSFQVFVETEGGLYCVQSSLRDLDEKNIVDSVLRQEFIQEIIGILLKLDK